MQALHAIYEHGIFRPTEPVNLPELCEVEIVVKFLPNGVKPLTSFAGCWEGERLERANQGDYEIRREFQ